MLFNKYVLIGLGLIAIGFILSPFIIGLPILVIGFLVADFGVLDYIIRVVPGLRQRVSRFLMMIKSSYRPYFRRKAVIKK